MECRQGHGVRDMIGNLAAAGKKGFYEGRNRRDDR